MSSSRQIDTNLDRVTIKTSRGRITLGPGSHIDGLWRVVQRELRTNSQVRVMCGRVTRATLIRWRNRADYPFPAPVVKFPANSGVLELWSRTEVEAWKAENLEDAVIRRRK
jgi:hypothetical protein